MTKKILLVDNNEFTSLYFRDIFWMHPGSNGDYYDVTTTKDLNGAKEFLQKETPDAVFIEPNACIEKKAKGVPSHLPSLEFVTELRSSPKGKDIPIAAYSDHQNETLEEEMSKAGADAFIVKGKQTAEGLVSIVDNLLKGHIKNH